MSATDSLFGPPLESAFKSKSFDSREQLRERRGFSASECKFLRRCQILVMSTMNVEELSDYVKSRRHEDEFSALNRAKHDATIILMSFKLSINDRFSH